MVQYYNILIRTPSSFQLKSVILGIDWNLKGNQNLFILSTLLSLSKRIHSIFLLRLFNDPVAMLFYHASLYLLIVVGVKGKGGGGGKRTVLALSVIFLALALTIKMNILLVLPAWAFIHASRHGLFSFLGHFVILIVVQASIEKKKERVNSLIVLDCGGMAISFQPSGFLYQWRV